MGDKEFVRNALDPRSEYTINRKIADELGWIPAIVLMDLVSEYFKQKSTRKSYKKVE